METVWSKKIVIVLILFIQIVGLSSIFFQSKLERDKIEKERAKYYIITDVNKKDVLKIEKKYLTATEIDNIKFTKSGDEKVYTIEDNRLIEDIIFMLDFSKFVYDDKMTMGEEDINLQILTSINKINLSVSAESKVATLKYNDSTFIVNLTDDFYNFIYDFYSKISN